MDNSIKFWDRLSANYDRQVESVFSEAYKKTIEYTRKYLKDTDTVLDIGCGTGITTVELAACAKQIHAVDLSGKMLDIAREKAIARNIGHIIFFQKSVFDQEFKKHAYDAVLAFNILCYIQEDSELIGRIYDLLKDGGLFISVTDCMGEKQTLLTVVSKLLGKLRVIPKMQSYTMAGLEAKIVKSNFKILESENLHTMPPNYFIAAKKQ